ncbi:MAG: exodeoxyribonuclease V subunit beta [Chromatiales bacterium]|nr:exodeoxyribonuclease V subunit beta [Chromatiales bacterium]
MQTTPDLDVDDVALGGWQLVEANAGTGKTWALEQLYRRLVEEAGIPVESILVMTFTRAATAELRGRIAGTLGKRIAGIAADDPARERLERARADMDLAAIHTIHGFCQRALDDHAFAAGQPLAREAAPSLASDRVAALGEWWKRQLPMQPQAVVAALVASGAGPTRWAEDFRKLLARPYLEHEVPDDGGLDAALAAFDEQATALRERWSRERDEFGEILRDGRLSKTYFGQPRIQRVFEWLDAVAAGVDAELPEHIDLRVFAPGDLGQFAKKGHTPPDHPMFARIERLGMAAAARDAAVEMRIAALRHAAFEWLDAQLPIRRRAARVLGYEDMLVELHTALNGAGGAPLAARLRRRYRAALIDEFQDTDPLQYEIVRRIFADDAPVFLVGDPKQAIYAFRGADVHTYFRARAQVATRWLLRRNWRSTQGMIAAVNVLYAANAAAFADASIDYAPNLPSSRSDGEPGAESLRVHWLDAALSATDAQPVFAQAAARLIAEQLAAHGTTRRAADFAVLVLQHAQAERMRAALAALGVPAITRTKTGVFETEEARELQWLLAACIEAGRAPELRRALATRVFGLDATAIAALASDDRAWAGYVDRAHEYQARWHHAGVGAMLERVFIEQQVCARLLAEPDGARRVTNLYHLLELTEQAEADAGRSPRGTLAWFETQRAERPAGDEDPSLLRLETDADAVQIVTMHAAKGLQYPVVVLPFVACDKAADDPKDLAIVHEQGAPLVSWGGVSADRGALGREQSRAEIARLLYVALTRAEQECHVFSGPVKLTKSGGVSMLDQLVNTEAAGEPDAQRRCWDALVAQAGGAIAFASAPSGTETIRAGAAIAAAGKARSFTGRLATARRIGSFSSLAGAGHADDAPDYDLIAAQAEAPEPASALSIAGFPRGARAGVCLHEILEHAELSAPQTDGNRDVVARTLLRHGYPQTWTEVALDMLGRVAHTALDSATGMTLADVGPNRMIRELEFHLGARFDARELVQLLRRHDVPVGELSATRIDGFLRGFVDLVFEHVGRWWIVDYKSNWLGADPRGYHAAAMDGEMRRHDYALQYLLYTVALHRWLGQRLPGYDYERNFGGVRYLFLRGLDPRAPECGVFAARPSRVFVDALDRLLAGAP